MGKEKTGGRSNVEIKLNEGVFILFLFRRGRGPRNNILTMGVGGGTRLQRKGVFR